MYVAGCDGVARHIVLVLNFCAESTGFCRLRLP